jgi:hypothetical protein
MTHVWLRAESKPREQRTALTPTFAKQLIDAGFRLTVEDSPQNPIPIADYEAAGCQIAAAHSWESTAPDDAFILGLKELDPTGRPLHHRHIHFAHVYKEQSGWYHTLQRFTAGGGKLYDLEYLVDERGRRIAAFGHWAGFAGAALALLGWAGQQQGRQPILPLIEARPSQAALVEDVRTALGSVEHSPSMLIIGALGRSGRGAVSLCEQVGIQATKWDLAETERGGPFVEALQHDLLLNCVFVQQSVPPFVTREMLAEPGRRLSLICDVSCDPYGEYNPLPIYDRCTTFDDPALRLIEGDRPLDLVAIDHLPSLLPIESSEDFCGQLMPHLLQLQNPAQGVWQRALDLFLKKSQLASSFVQES